MWPIDSQLHAKIWTRPSHRQRIAAIIGAFLAGMALAEATEDLVPFFFVSIGMQLRLDVFRDPTVLLLTILVFLVAVITKLFGAGAGALSMGLRRAGQVGMGMVPRGEVGVVVAQIGFSLAVINDQLYAVVLFGWNREAATWN